MSDRTPTTLDKAWEALCGPLVTVWQCICGMWNSNGDATCPNCLRPRRKPATWLRWP